MRNLYEMYYGRRPKSADSLQVTKARQKSHTNTHTNHTQSDLQNARTINACEKINGIAFVLKQRIVIMNIW